MKNYQKARWNGVCVCSCIHRIVYAYGCSHFFAVAHLFFPSAFDVVVVVLLLLLLLVVMVVVVVEVVVVPTYLPLLLLPQRTASCCKCLRSQRKLFMCYHCNTMAVGLHKSASICFNSVYVCVRVLCSFGEPIAPYTRLFVYVHLPLGSKYRLWQKHQPENYAKT